MIRVEGSAWRVGSEVTVQLAGLVSKFGVFAEIDDVFPHGVIKYSKDPDCLEVFIQETKYDDKRENGENSAWQDKVQISLETAEISKFDCVKIFVNGSQELELPILVCDKNAAKVICWPPMGAKACGNRQTGSV